MWRRWSGFLVLSVCLVPSVLRADEILNIGDPAPALTVASWVKGEPVERFEADKTYVVEFWATWCPPCRTSIPHLTGLARRHQGVTFIGVDVREQDPAKVRTFVTEMGARMDYRVALDAIPTGGEPDAGAMHRGWLQAAVEDGIPTAFVVQNTRLAWIGHPLDLDAPLDQIAAGTWNPSTQIPDRLAVKRRDRHANEIRALVFPLYNDDNYPAVVTALDQSTSADPALADEFAWLRFASLCNGADVEAGLILGAQRLQGNHDNPYALNNDAWNVVSPRLKHEPDPRVARLALQAAQRAVDLLQAQNANHLDTLAEAQYRTGAVAAAIATEVKALQLAEAEAKDPAAPGLQRYRDRIDRYRKAASPPATQP